MKLFIFAIGGTGERVLRSLTMLLAAGVKTFNNYDIYPIIVDYDEENGDKIRTVEVLKNYALAHDAAYAKHAANNNLQGGQQTKDSAGAFFAAQLRSLPGLENYVFPFKPATPHEKFKEFIGFDLFAGDLLGTESFLTSLYDKSNRADTELNLDMTVGFKGNPNIGSVVFNTIGDTDQFNRFRALYNPKSGDKVVVVGSLFGGTGASGIPEIVKVINAKCTKPEPKDNTNHIATLQILPYFAPIEQAQGAIKATRFNSKTKAALHYYEDSQLNALIDCKYFVGDFYPTVLPYCDGGKEQLNNANLVELIAAMMIEHFVSDRTVKDKVNNSFKFSLNANIVVNKDQKSGDRLFYQDFDRDSKLNILNSLISLAAGLKYFHDNVWTKEDEKKDYFKLLDLQNAVDKGKADSLGTQPFSQLCSALEEFYHKYQCWLKELDFEGKEDVVPANSHRFALCDMTKSFDGLLVKDVQGAKDDEKSDSSFFSSISSMSNSVMSVINSKSSFDFEFDTRMNYHLRDNGKDDGHYDTKTNKLRVGHDPEWVFADILHSASVEACAEIIKNK